VSFLTQATPVALALTLVLVLVSACLGRLLGGHKAAGQTAREPPAGGATSAPADLAEPQGASGGNQMMTPPATPPPESSTPAPGSSAPEPNAQPTPQAGHTVAFRNLDSATNSNSNSTTNSYGKSVPAFATPQRRRAGHAATEDSADSLRTGSLSGNTSTVSSSSSLVAKGDVIHDAVDHVIRPSLTGASQHTKRPRRR